MKIHPTAIISPDAQVGADVEIGPYTVIEGKAVIGDRCVIGSCVLLGTGARLAEEVKVSHGAAIGTPPQDLKYAGEETTAEVGARSVLREYCTVNRATANSYRTIVGADCLLMAYCHVAHDCRVGDRVILANAVNMGGHVHIGDWAILGGMTAVHQFVNIGSHVMIGGKSRVTKDIPPYCLTSGEKMRYDGLNKIGLKRRGFSDETLHALKEAYRLIYQTDMLRSEALAEIKSKSMTPEVEGLVKFFEASERGVI